MIRCNACPAFQLALERISHGAFHMMITLPELGRASGFRVIYPAEVLILESGLASGLLL